MPLIDAHLVVQSQPDWLVLARRHGGSAAARLHKHRRSLYDVLFHDGDADDATRTTASSSSSNSNNKTADGVNYQVGAARGCRWPRQVDRV